MLYALLGIMICIIFTIYSIHSEKTLMNPLTVFCGIWALVLLFSSLHFYTLYEPSDSTYNIILIGIVSFIIGYYFIKFFGKTITISKRNKTYNGKVIYVLNYRLMYVLLIICLLAFLRNFINIIGQVASFNLGNIQTLLQSSEYETNNSALWSALSLLIVSPVSFAIPAITAADFWAGKRDRKLLYMTIAMLLLRVVSSANRSTILVFIVYLAVIGILTTSKKRKYKTADELNMRKRSKQRNRRMIVGVLAVGILTFVIMTMSRGSRLFRNLYLNFAMPPEMLEVWIQHVDDVNIIGYGMATLNGFIYPVMYFVKNIFRFSSLPQLFQSIYDMTMLTDTSWQWIGVRIRANAYVSVFWFLYLDARILGVIIGMFAYGGVLAGSFKKVVKNMCAKQLSIYCLMFYGILYSFARMPFTLSKYSLALVFIAFLSYRRKIIEE